MNRRKKRQAFTLVEILVAVSICSLLMLFLVAVAGQVSGIWQGGNRQAQQGRNARALLDFIGQELSLAMVPVAGTSSAGTGNLQFLLNPAWLSADLRNPDLLFWQAPAALDSDQGDLAEVGYFVRWIGTRPVLCRFFVSPGDTANYLIYDDDPNAWLSDEIIGRVAPAARTASDPDSHYQGLFAENVLGFWITCYAYDAAGSLVVVSDGGVYDSRTTIPENRLPALVQIDMVQIDSTSAMRITDPSQITEKYGLARKVDGTVDTSLFVRALPEAIRPAARSYSTRVFLKRSQ